VKFQPEHLDGVNTIARHDGASIWVAGQQFSGAVIVPWAGPPLGWGASPVAGVTWGAIKALYR
jgi:hypothetical protein